MAKLWEGRSDGQVDRLADDFNSSIRVDSRMYEQDIRGSIAHAEMLGRQGIIGSSSAAKLQEGLESILNDIRCGRLQIDMTSEDIHTFVEQELTKRVGDVGKMLHTARSRNDQVAQDFRLYLRDAAVKISERIRELANALTQVAKEHLCTIMPGYTHLQRAQPILFSHQLMAYVFMLLRDRERLADWNKRANVSPIGSCALAGTTYDIDREFEASLLGFAGVTENSIDGVSDRDFALEMLSDLAILMMHLSRLSEELILWSSWEFRFITLSDAYTTGSSIMPQKKNSDMAELIRGKSGRVYGDLTSLLTTMKGIPLAYNKDMQEDKEPVFDAVDTVILCLSVAAPMVRTMTVHEDRMREAAAQGFINATDLADYLTKKGMPFRQAYKITGEIVHECMEKNMILETAPLSFYREKSELLEEDLYQEIDLMTCVKKRKSLGGTGICSVKKQIRAAEEKLNG